MGELEFDNREDLKAWLETRSHEDAIAISSRSALRVVPFLSNVLETEASKRRSGIILPIFRSIAVTNSARWGIAELATATHSATLFVNFVADSAAAAFPARSTLSIRSVTRSAAVLSTYSTADVAASAADSAADALSARSTLSIRSVTQPVTGPVTYSAASSAALSDAWKIISEDAQAIMNGTIDTRSLWHDTPSDDATAHWHRLRDALLSAKDEGWAVWTDWYEARLRGDPVDIDLERAKALIPDAIWEQGPKVANAEIRRLIDEHAAKKRIRAEEQVSPSPVIRADGKLDAVPTPGIDISDDSPDLPDLLRRQRANVAVVVDAIASMPGNEFRAAPDALIRYDGEIEGQRSRLSIGYLDDMRAIARDEYLSLYRQKFFDTEGGLRRAFLNVFALHKSIAAHYPLNAERRTLLESFDNPAAPPDPATLEAAIADVSEGIAAGLEAGAITERYGSYMGGMMDDVAHVTFTFPVVGTPKQTLDPQLADPPSPRMGLAKQIFLKVAAVAGGSVNRILAEVKNAPVASSIGIAGLLQTPWGKSFLDALIRLRDLLWALF